MKSKNGAVHSATDIFPYFCNVDSVVEQQKNPVANAYTRIEENMQSHTLAQWGEGFNKPTVTWFYGGVSGLSQETR